MEMIGHLKMKVGSDEKVLLMEQLPYYTLVPSEVALRNKIVTCISLCPKSPSVRRLVACLPVRLLFKSTKRNALYPV